MRYERIKTWVIFTQNRTPLYCSFYFIENLTFPHLPFHFLSDWPPNLSPKKEKMRKVSLYLISCSSLLYLKDTCFDLLQFSFPTNMEGSKRITTRFGHLSSSSEKSKKTKRKIQPYDRKFVVKQYIKSL